MNSENKMIMDTHPQRLVCSIYLLLWCVYAIGQEPCANLDSDDRWLRPHKGARLVRDCGRIFQNNSILNANELFDPPNGLRCFSAISNTPVAEWILPSGRIITNTNRSIGDLHINRVSSSGYIELIRSKAVQNSGVYTCNISSRNGLQILHVGVYTSEEPPILQLNEMEIKPVYDTTNTTVAATVLNCSSNSSPATSVTWLRDEEVIEEDNYHRVNQILRDAETAVYDNMLIISGTVVESGLYKCVVNDSLMEKSSARSLDVVFPLLNNLSYNNTMKQLSWNITEISSSPTITAENHFTVTPIVTGYILSIKGGRCFEYTKNVTLPQYDYVFLPDYGIDLENGANYTAQLSAMNEVAIGNFSMPYRFTTSSLVPDSPESLNASVVGVSSILLSWKELECSKRHGVIIGYIIQQDGSSNHFVDRSVNSLTVTGLSPFHEYLFKVAATNEAGAGKFIETKARILTEWMIIVIGLGGGLFIVLLCLFCICCCCITTKRRHKQKRKKNQKTSCLVSRGDSYEDGTEMRELMSAYGGQEDISIEPVIEIFPDNMLTCLGEYVILYVSVHGNPPPTLTWYHNNENIIYNNSTIEISEDGTLSIPSMEARHVGEYKLVATNEHGSCESEMELYLESEDTPNLFRALSMSLLIDTAPVPVSSLEEYVASHHSKSNDAFRCEFLSLNSENSGATTIGEMPQNRALNRFKHIVPYDDNRVVLRPISGFDDCQHDYINASYVDGQNLRNAFIAAQGPLPHTMTDFWRMVWQERVKLIVMLCNTVEGHRVRCQQYWPSSGSQNYGPFRIKLETEHKYSDYILRTFEIKFSATTDDPKLIEHYQFTSWPDNLLPENSSSILAMHNKALSNLSLEGPILVHCSAGVGRTGAFIAMDRALEQTKEGVVDVMGIVNDMRQQRMKMVQTLAQYIDIYDSVLKHVVCGETKIDAVDLRVALKTLRTVDQNTGQTELEKQFQVLQKITPSPLEVDRNVTAKNRDMNRSMEFLPRDTKRVVLYGGGGDYIHATFVDGYKQKKAFIVTQGPQEDTCNDFWKMIHQYNCGTIVMLSDLLEYNREVCYPYWPKAGSEDYSDYNVEFMKESNEESLNMREFLVTCTSKENKNEKAHPVTQFQVLNWMPDGQCSNFVTITRLLEEVTRNQIKTGNHPIVVHCSDTVGRSAIFCAALSAIEQCKTEVAIDIFHVVKGVRMQKPGAVVSVEQYSLIFDVVLTYLDSIDNYANFQC